MAELTATLPEVQDKAQVIVDPAFSGVGTALSALAQGLNSFDNAWSARSNRKAREAATARQQREDKRAEQERVIKAAATQGAFDITTGRFGAFLSNQQAMDANPNLGGAPGVPVSEDLAGMPTNTITSAALASAKDLTKFKAAADQGKIPQISLRAQVDLKYQQLIAQYGQMAGPIIAEQFKALGIDDAFLHNLRDDVSQEKSFRDAQNKALADAFETGLKYLDPQVASTYTREQIINFGLDQMRLDHEQAQTKTGLEISGMKATQTREQTLFDKTQAAEKDFSLGVQRGKSVLSGIINLAQTAQDLGGPAGSNPAREARIAEMREKLRVQLPRVVENVISSMNITDQKQAQAVRDELTRYYTDTFLTPWEENHKAVGTALKAVQDRLGLNSEQAMPLLSQLKRAGLPYEVMGPMFDSIARDQGFQDKLRQEVAGYEAILEKDPFSTTAQVQLATIVSLMKGNETLQNLEVRDPQTAALAVRNIRGQVRNLQRGVATGEISDPGALDTYLNNMGVVITAANKINHQSGQGVLDTAALEIGSAYNRGAIEKLMTNPEFADEAKIIGQGLRAQSARLLESYKKLGFDGYYGVKYDKSQGKYVLGFNRQAWEQNKQTQLQKAASGQMMLAGEGGLAIPSTSNSQSISQPKPSQSVIDRLDRMNGLLDFLGTTTQWDDNAMKGTPLEVKNFFAVNEPTEAMKKQMQARKPKVNEDAEFNKVISKVDAALEQAKQPLRAPSAILPDAQEILGKLPKDYQQNFNLLQQAAERQGVPIDMAARLIQQESGFNPAAKSGKGAVGLGQIVPKHWNEISQERYGKPVDQLSAAENVDLSMWILQSLYRKFGSWEDAVSAYHSGRPLREAMNANDGNMSTPDYVRGIVG